MTAEASGSGDPGGLRAHIEAGRAAIIATAHRYGAHNVRLFGSLARGGHTEASDVDLLVDFSAGVGLFQVARLVAKLKDLLLCMTVPPDARDATGTDATLAVRSQSVADAVALTFAPTPPDRHRSGIDSAASRSDP